MIDALLTDRRRRVLIGFLASFCLLWVGLIVVGLAIGGSNGLTASAISIIAFGFVVSMVGVALLFLLNCWAIDHTPWGKVNTALIAAFPLSTELVRRHWLMSHLWSVLLPREFFEAVDAETLGAQREWQSKTSVSGPALVTASGVSGMVSLYEDRIEIVRRGIASYLLHGSDRERVIPLDDIVAVDIEEARGRRRGYIHFARDGTSGDSRGIYSAVVDPYSVVYQSRDNEEFRRLAEEADRLLGLRR
jgi:hypothetical protein